MKRTAIMILAISSSLLLGGCWPYWEDGDGYGRDHDRGREYHRRYDRHDDRGYERRDNDQGEGRYHNRDHDNRDD